MHYCRVHISKTPVARRLHLLRAIVSNAIPSGRLTMPRPAAGMSPAQETLRVFFFLSFCADITSFLGIPRSFLPDRIHWSRFGHVVVHVHVLFLVGMYISDTIITVSTLSKHAGNGLRALATLICSFHFGLSSNAVINRGLGLGVNYLYRDVLVVRMWVLLRHPGRGGGKGQQASFFTRCFQKYKD